MSQHLNLKNSRTKDDDRCRKEPNESSHHQAVPGMCSLTTLRAILCALVIIGGGVMPCALGLRLLSLGPTTAFEPFELSSLNMPGAAYGGG